MVDLHRSRQHKFTKSYIYTRNVDNIFSTYYQQQFVWETKY